MSVSIGHQPSKKVPVLDVVAKSSLQGTTFNFPAPLSVSQAEKRPVSFTGKLFSNGDFPFDLTLAEDLKVNAKLNVNSNTSDSLPFF